MTYMMAETSYYHPLSISARKLYSEGEFGELFYTEAEYHHSGMEYRSGGTRTASPPGATVFRPCSTRPTAPRSWSVSPASG